MNRVPAGGVEGSSGKSAGIGNGVTGQEVGLTAGTRALPDYRPFVADRDFTLHVGDVREILPRLDAGSVDCVVTSPPYWGLRDYGTGGWDGGDPDCDHVARVMKPSAKSSLEDHGEDGRSPQLDALPGIPYRDVCGKCGARRVDAQLGLEATPDLYVAEMVAVFRQVRRVLAPHGTCWVNLGDSYASVPGSGLQGENGQMASRTIAQVRDSKAAAGMGAPRRPPGAAGIKPKDLVGIPWRVAFALQADGWYLRSDIVWSKPNPMPESVTDRPTKSHEYVFLLTKGPRYFFDAEAVREPHRLGPNSHSTGTKAQPQGRSDAPNGVRKPFAIEGGGRQYPAGRNVRSVWEIPTQPYPEAHFATFPEALPERCIKAGCPEGGVVLDPFMGSGTTALVARRLGRRSIGVELSPEYAELCGRRLQQLSLLAEASA